MTKTIYMDFDTEFRIKEILKKIPDFNCSAHFRETIYKLYLEQYPQVKEDLLKSYEQKNKEIKELENRIETEQEREKRELEERAMKQKLKEERQKSKKDRIIENFKQDLGRELTAEEFIEFNEKFDLGEISYFDYLEQMQKKDGIFKEETEVT